MISLSTFLVAVEQNRARVTKYQSGGDGKDGECDCIGLIIGAVRLAGGSWKWTHGSNYTARNRIRGLRPVSKAGELNLGELVFKAHEPGESGYDLPDTYKNSPDKRDYYHVGVVTSVSPFCVTHCTGAEGGIMRDSSLGKWRFAGELDLVNYDEGDVPMDEVLYKAVVKADNGYPVKMRNQPSQKASVMASVPLGTPVDVLQETDASWAKIGLDGQTGYMMRKFLSSQPEDDSLPGNTEGYIEIPRLKLLEIKACLSDTLCIIEQALIGKG